MQPTAVNASSLTTMHGLEGTSTARDRSIESPMASASAPAAAGPGLYSHSASIRSGWQKPIRAPAAAA